MACIIASRFALLFPIVIAVGAYYGTVVTPIILIAAIIACIILVSLGRIKGNLIYFYTFALSLSLLYQTTMMGVDVVGSDIHNELYYAKLNAIQAWDYNLVRTDNASFVIWFIAPMISKFLAMDMVWVFKAVLPIFLALVPVVLFSIYKRQFGEMRAFFAVIFFMIIPVFSMEMGSIAKTMVAELFLALMIWVVVSDWKWQYKAIGICVTLVMQVVCHYTVGTIGICFLLGMFVIRLVTTPLKWNLFSNRKVPILLIAGCLVIGGSAFWIYHSMTAGGWMAAHITGLVVQYLPIPPSASPVPVVANPVVTWFSGLNWLSTEVSRGTLVNAAMGLDFMSVPIDGKIFRIVQFLTQIMIIVGAIRLAFFNKFNVTAEFVGFVGVSAVVLAACICLVNFAYLINMTRFYHFSLFFLAPMFVIGCEAIANMARRPV